MGLLRAAVAAATIVATCVTTANAGQCLSSGLVEITQAVEAAFAKYYPYVTDYAALFIPDESPEGSKARYDELKALLDKLDALGDQLTKVEDKIIRERYTQLILERTTAYELKAETWIGKYYYTGFYYPLSILSSYAGEHADGKGTPELLEAYKKVPAYVDQWLAKMDEETPDYFFQMEKTDLDYLTSSITSWMATRDHYASPFGTEHAAEVDAVMAAFQKLHDAYDTTKSQRKVLRTFENPSIAYLPNGEALYNWHMMTQLTTNAEEYSAANLHQQGIDITNDLNQRCLKAYQKATDGKGANDLQSMNTWILTSPENNPYKNVSEVLDEYLRAGAMIGKVMMKEYGVYPMCPYSIVTCFDLDPTGAECGGGIAYYMGGNFKDGMCHEAGTFVLDFSPEGDLADFPKSMTATLLMHEANPGHHMQVMLGQEADTSCVPPFITTANYINVMVEGWALYCETTGFGLGVYEDPLFEIGHYQDRLLRSCRLTVDTGIHQMKWSMEECVQYILSNTGFSEGGVRAQCERYAAWPAQALAYMVGSLAYENARKKVETSLGDKFDPRTYHYNMLKYGDMALDSIAELADSYIAQAQSGAGDQTDDAVTSPETAEPEAAPSSSSGVSTGALVGGIVGGAVVGALIGAGVMFFLRRKKESESSESTTRLN